MSESKKLTNNAGAPIANNQNVMTAGLRGPMLLQDIGCSSDYGCERRPLWLQSIMFWQPLARLVARNLDRRV